MKKSDASIHNDKTTWRDEAAKSIGYFAKNDIICLSAEMVREIKAMALETGENVRLSLHENPKMDFHEMIIFQHRDKFYRPKKHIAKAKSFHIIEGEMAVYVFDDAGAVTDVGVIDGRNAFVYRVGAGIFHTDIPLTDYVVHHESTLGPFMGNKDREFAPWSPDGSDPVEFLKYRDQLLELID